MFKTWCAAKGSRMGDELIRYMDSVTELERARGGAERVSKRLAKEEAKR